MVQVVNCVELLSIKPWETLQFENQAKESKEDGQRVVGMESALWSWRKKNIHEMSMTYNQLLFREATLIRVEIG